MGCFYYDPSVMYNATEYFTYAHENLGVGIIFGMIISLIIMTPIFISCLEDLFENDKKAKRGIKK